MTDERKPRDRELAAFRLKRNKWLREMFDPEYRQSVDMRHEAALAKSRRASSIYHARPEVRERNNARAREKSRADPEVTREQWRAEARRRRSEPGKRVKLLAQKRAQNVRRRERDRDKFDPREIARRAAVAEARRATLAVRRRNFAIASLYRRRAREERAIIFQSQKRRKNTMQLVIWKAMRGKGSSDCGGAKCKILARRCSACACRETTGLAPSELRSDVESKFLHGMSFQNYGEWEVDHIFPCMGYDLRVPTEARACFLHTNLRPLWKAENRRKWAHPHEKQLALL